ncbi:tRNA-modifying protein YgfZ [hydrothermal vent metagenome]|uniref:tRNA-modifying protein YgfZ n=1 Tax=hydrothermal vent metagenome TaxID=652676 RepID=A0A3B1A1Q0_9ZZZZ
MEASWKSHLESVGAVFEDTTVIHYGNAKQELASIAHKDKTVICALSDYGIIKISGTEAQTFLQSQFSNDVNLVTANQAQLNSYCSPKGRVLTLFTLFQIANNYYLQLPISLLDSTLKRLTMFKMRADVNLDDVTDNLLCVGLAGSSAQSILTKYLTDVPSLNYSCGSENSLTVIRLANETTAITQPRFLIFGDNNTLANLWTNNLAQLTAIAQQPWSLLDIQSGLPSVSNDTVDAFVPQMLNLQLLSAINFKKGCYPGQEIVARTQYLGKLKKRMYLLKSDSNELFTVGTDLSTENAEDDQSKGKIVNCQLSATSGIEALAVLQINSINNGKILIKQAPHIKFTVHQLPYPFEELKEN